MAPGENRKYGVSGCAAGISCRREDRPRCAHGWLLLAASRLGETSPASFASAIGPAIDAANRDPRELNEQVRTWIDAQLASDGMPRELKDRFSYILSKVAKHFVDILVIRLEKLNIQIRHCQRILLDELATWLHLIAHQGGENVVGSLSIFDSHAHQPPSLRIDGRVPKLEGFISPRPL